MSLLQHYYTSCSKGTTGFAGFQVKAMSPGLSADDLKTVNNMVSYRVPTSLNVNDIASHPIALRYDYVGRSKSILVCSQSSGPDENGRPGNFFAHTVITDIRDFEIFPPIMFWRHTFWKTSDPSDQLQIPPEPAFELAPSLEFERIWPFLDSAERREWFSKLLCAVIQYDRIKRPIVILDDIDNVALWIAAVTFALPNVFRPFLSFSTYHHDPYQVPFRITGTTRDSKFRFSSDEYISYFIINAEAGRVSDCESARVVDFICRNMNPGAYEDKLLSFFSMCNARLPRSPAGMGDKLEQVANLFLAVRSGTLSPADAGVQKGLDLLINGVASLSTVETEELDDVRSAADLLWKALYSGPSAVMLNYYVRVLQLLRKIDPSFYQRCPTDLELAANLLLHSQPALADQLLDACRKVYGTRLGSCASQPEFISSLANRTSASGCEVHSSIWKQLVPLMGIDGKNNREFGDLLQGALRAVNQLSGFDALQPMPEAERLLDLVRFATQNDPSLLWDNVLAWSQNSSNSVVLVLYYLTVAKLSLADRRAQRRRLDSIEPRLIAYEFQRDIRLAGPQGLAPLLESWVNHLQAAPVLQSELVSLGLSTFWPSFSEEQKHWHAERVLSSHALSSHLEDEWKTELLTIYLSGVTLKVLDRQVVQLYEKYYGYPYLDGKQRAVIGGALAMTTGNFRGRSSIELQKWLATLDETGYRSEAEKLIARFFARNSGIDAHREMLQATYVCQFSDCFWELYWSYFKALLLDATRAPEFVKIMGFWFDESPGSFAELPYLVQSFFLQLPSLLSDIRGAKETAKEFQKAAQAINVKAAQQPWYFLIDDFFAEKKKNRLLGILRRADS